MGFNIEKMILTEAIKGGHIRLKDLTPNNEVIEVSKDEEQKLLFQMMLNGEITIDNLQTKGILNQETISSLIGLFYKDENSDHLDIKSLGHYSDLEPAGSGAMSWVYKAYDRNLQRHVALKVLKLSDPKIIQRFIREARSQAQIEHPNICKVYEAGEFQGRSFIAMQYINGKTLKEIYGELSSEIKIDLMKQIAEAVHEAHRKNLIHRDLKPANLMVEEKDGSLIPYVVDFGLVREAGAPGLTQTDILIGSPFYMSPEQASGKVHSLDRRTDIFSLGVTLYELFSGTLPFIGEDNIQVLRKIVEEDPAPLRRTNRFISRDLETIILKCLEKDSEKRYDSAKDLSEDLQRYLSGEPITAKPSTIIDRLSKKAKKNKTTVAILGLAFLMVCIFGWIGIQSRFTARKQIAVAQQFGEDINQVESMMRIARMRPLHDISAEQERARKRIEQIDQQSRKLGTVAFAPGEYAIGKGYFVLQDYEKAKQHLESAWQSGYKRASVASVLGKTYVALYQEKLREIDKITDNTSREEQRKQIHKTFRDPALFYLKNSSGEENESQDFIEALMAYVEQRYEIASKKAAAAYAKNGWLYEAKKIQADVHLQLARNSRDAGDYKTSMAEFLQADKDYLEAITIGRSDASLYTGIGSSKVTMMHMETYYGGGDPSSNFKEAVEFSNQALLINPRNVSAYELMAEANWRMGEYEVRNGKDPSGHLNNSFQNVKTALAINPSAELYSIMAAAYWSLSIYQHSQNLDERPIVQKSIEACQKALQINPRHRKSLNLLGLGYYGLAWYEMSHGLDPNSNFDKGIKAFEAALEIVYSERTSSNLATLYYDRGEYELAQGQDARKSAKKSIEAYEKALQFNPNAAGTWSNLAGPYMTLASYEIEHGGDPRVSLNKALEVHSKAQQLNPNYHQSYNNMAAVFALQASYEIMQGMDPSVSLQKAVENCGKAIKVRPNYAYAFTNLGTAYRYMAESEKQNPIPSLKKAEEAFAKSLELSPDNTEALDGKGNVALARAEWLMGGNKSPQNEFANAEKFFGDALKTNPKDLEALIGFAELHRHHAEWLVKKGQSPADEVRAGLDAIAKIFSTRPQSSKAFAIQAQLYLIQAQDVRDAAQKAKLLDQGRSSLEKGLSLNRNLTRQYYPYTKSR
jgi:eukaryotic-like serine/threonine-protein kinase